MIRFFFEPLSEGWVYPCTIEEIESQIARVPADYVEGISSIGLCRSTHRDQYANARYFYGREACIRMYSWNASLSVRLPAHTKYRSASRYLDREIDYGMKIEQAGPRLICQWDLANLNTWTLEHVLMHEIGHHIYYKSRLAQGLAFQPITAESEKFAEAFARRYSVASNALQ